MPMMGGGFFSSAMGGMMAVIGSLMSHLLYGSVLGAIAGAPQAGAAHASWTRVVAMRLFAYPPRPFSALRIARPSWAQSSPDVSTSPTAT